MFCENRLIDPDERWSFEGTNKQAVATVIQAGAGHSPYIGNNRSGWYAGKIEQVCSQRNSATIRRKMYVLRRG